MKQLGKKTVREWDQEFYTNSDNLWACIIALTDKKPDAEARKRIQKEALGNVECLEEIFRCFSFRIKLSDYYRKRGLNNG